MGAPEVGAFLTDSEYQSFFGKFFQRMFQGGILHAFAEFMQLIFCRAAQDARRARLLGERIANLHLDIDSANRATFVLQFNDYFGRQLSQFCGECSINGSNAQYALTQSEHLARLRKIGRRNTDKLLLQPGQCMHGV